jgi:hypothetical protein
MASREPDLTGGEDCERGRPVRGKLSTGRELSQSELWRVVARVRNCGAHLFLRVAEERGSKASLPGRQNPPDELGLFRWEDDFGVE